MRWVVRFDGMVIHRIVMRTVMLSKVRAPSTPWGLKENRFGDLYFGSSIII